MSYRYDKGCVNYAREKVVTLVNRRIDEMLDGHKRNYVKKKSYIVSNFKNKRSPEKIQRNWNAKVQTYPEDLIKVFDRIKATSQPYTALGLEISYITRYDVDIGKHIEWSMYKLMRHMGYDFNVLQTDPRYALNPREQCPPIEHISPVMYNWFSRGSVFWHDAMCDFKKIAEHMRKTNLAIEDADIIAKRFVDEYNVCKGEDEDGRYWDASNYHLWNKIPKRTVPIKESLTRLLDGAFD